MKEGIRIKTRDATSEDSQAISNIYGTNRSTWLANTQSLGFPIIVAEVGGEVVGFAALTPFHPAAEYRSTGTGSLYVHPDYQRKGVGKALIAALKKIAPTKNLHVIIAGVNTKNEASLSLLESQGFERVGFFKQIAHKHGQWIDEVCLQLII